MTGIRIEVVVAADGSVAAATHNVTGQECLPYIQLLEALLDAQTIDSSYTADWWATQHSAATEVPVADPAATLRQGR